MKNIEGRQKNNNELADAEHVKPSIESTQQIPEIVQKTKGFFDMIKSSYNSPDLDGEDPLEPESKEQANENIEGAANQFEQLLGQDNQVRKPTDPTAYVEGMAFLADHYGRSLDNQINGYELYPEDMREEIRKKDQESEALFLKAGQKLFPEIAKPQSAEDAISQLQNLSGQEYEHSLLNPDLQFLVSVAGDKRRLIKELDRVALFNGYSVANSMDSAMRVNGGELSESHRQEMLGQQKMIYQLRLLRDAVAGEVYGRSDINNHEMSGIERARRKLGIAGKFEEGAISFNQINEIAEEQTTATERRNITGKVEIENKLIGLNIEQGEILTLAGKPVEVFSSRIGADKNTMKPIEELRETGTSVEVDEISTQLVEEENEAEFNAKKVFLQFKERVESAIESCASFKKLQELINDGYGSSIRGGLSRISTMGANYTRKGLASRLLQVLEYPKNESNEPKEYQSKELIADVSKFIEEVLATISMEEIIGLDFNKSEDVLLATQRIDQLRRAKMKFGFNDASLEAVLTAWILKVKEGKKTTKVKSAAIPELPIDNATIAEVAAEEKKVKGLERLPEWIEKDKFEANERLLAELEQIYESQGETAINQKFYEIVNEILVQIGREPIKEGDIGEVTYYKSNSASVDRIVGKQFFRPVFVFKDSEGIKQFTKHLCGKAMDIGGMLLNHAEYFINEDLKKAGVLIDNGELGSVRHEMMHSIDVNVDKRRGINGVLSELLAYYNDIIVVKGQTSEKNQEYVHIDDVPDNLWVVLEKLIGHDIYRQELDPKNILGEQGYKQQCKQIVDKSRELKKRFGDIVTLRKMATCLTLTDFMRL